MTAQPDPQSAAAETTNNFAWLPVARGLFLLVVLSNVLLAGWPDSQDLNIFPDSKAYIDWPNEDWISTEPFEPGGSLYVMGQRPPTYPLLLKLVGAERSLFPIQFVISFLAWTFLGWCTAREPGVLVGAVFSMFPAVWLWNGAVLSESLSLSLMAVAIAATLLLLRAWSWSRFGFWALAMAAYGLTRDINLYALPFLAVPALRALGWRGGLVAVTAGLLFAFGTWSAKKHDRGMWPLMNAMQERILTNEDYRAEMVGKGMPDNPQLTRFPNRRAIPLVLGYERHAPEYLEWIRAEGMLAYGSWLLRHPRTFSEAKGELMSRVRFDPQHYSNGIIAPSVVAGAKPFYDFVLPWYLWCLLVLIPLAEFGVSGKPSPLGLLTAALVLLTYTQAYLCFFGDGIEHDRHMLPAFVLYRLTTALGVAATAKMFYRACKAWTRRRRGTSTA